MSPRTRTVLIAICAAIVVLAVAVVLVVRAVLTDTRIRALAASYVKEYTGRDLVIAGPIALSFVPWLGAELKDVTISAPAPSTSSPPPSPARFAELGLKIRLLPLIRGQIEVGGIRARGGAFSFAGYDLRRVELTTGAFGGEQATDLSLAGTIAPIGSQAVPLSLASRMVFNVARQALELSEMAGSIGGLSFTGELHGRQMIDAPAIDSRIQTNTFDLRRLLSDLGTPYAAADPKALTSASLSARMAVSGSSLRLTDLVVALDGSRLTGSAIRTGTVRHEWRAQLHADTLDLDRYLPGPSPAVSPASASDPYEALRELTADATVDVQQLKVYGLQLSNTTATLTARNGIVLVAPARTALYGGSGELSGKMDVRSPVPSYHVEGRLARVAVQPVLTAAQSISALAGTGDLSLRLDASGSDPARLTPSMSGYVDMSVRDGHLEGTDVLKLLMQARALSDQLRGRPASAPSNPADRTKFSRLAGSATIERGVARNDDLVIEAPSLDATGAGRIDLASQAIDYVLRASSREAGNVMVPIAISGPFASPSYSVQAGSMAKEAAKQELRKQLKRGLGRLFKKPVG